MTEKRCETCRFWGWPDDALNPGRGEVGESRDCQIMSDWPAFTGEHPLERDWKGPHAFPFVGADGASVVTPPDFGCVLWESRT